MYFVKVPHFVKRLYFRNNDLQENNVVGSKIYLTFDDGPHPDITPFILETLDQFKIKATFFCLGNQIEKHPQLFEKVNNSDHQIGNHTFNHVKGWEVSNYTYFKEILKTEVYTKNKLFRPPYGQIKQNQLKTLTNKNYKVVLWDVMPGDFDKRVNKELCLVNAISNSEAGTNIVFHENKKSESNMKYALPRYIEDMLSKGFTFDKIG